MTTAKRILEVNGKIISLQRLKDLLDLEIYKLARERDKIIGTSKV